MTCWELKKAENGLKGLKGDFRGGDLQLFDFLGTTEGKREARPG
jgi:hypothetical protein